MLCNLSFMQTIPLWAGVYVWARLSTAGHRAAGTACEPRCVSSRTAACWCDSDLRCCSQLRFACKPERCYSPGACAMRMCYSHGGVGPSVTLASSLPRGWGQDQPHCCVLQFLLVLNCSFPSFTSPGLFLVFKSVLFSCNPEVSKQALLLLFNCRKHQWRWLSLCCGCIQVAGRELLGRLLAVGIRGLQEHWTVSLWCFCYSLCKGSSCHMQPFRHFIHRFLSVLQKGKKPLCSSL